MFGPMIPPIGKIEVNRPSILARDSGKTRAMIETPLGMIPPPPNAWTIRQAISM